ncbi:MAG: hypothetical protein ACFE95_05060 [Candidatus Hodarchaeota archaeon]
MLDANEAQPEPFGGKYLVYFKQEEIIVTLYPESGKALVNASYVFHNNAINATDIKIKLPFLSKPQVLELILDGVSYTNLTWQLTPIFDEVTGASKRMFESIIFPLHFNSSEDIIVEISYYRNYKKFIPSTPENSSNTVHYSFYYMVGTAKVWNHTIDNAYFEFRVPQEMIIDDIDFDHDSLFSNSEIKEDYDYKIFIVEFDNWIPEQYYLGVYWKWIKTTPRSIMFYLENLAVVVIFMGFFVISGLLLINTIRKR